MNDLPENSGGGGVLNLRITSVQCRICNRTLKNPAAVAKGVGPVCGRGFKTNLRRVDRSTIDMFDAEFEYRYKADILVIHDLNRGAKSVTNDMENVIRRIRRELPGKVDELTKIIYRDSQMIYDGVRILPGGRVEIYSIGVSSVAEALEKIGEKGEAHE